MDTTLHLGPPLYWFWPAAKLQSPVHEFVEQYYSQTVTMMNLRSPELGSHIRAQLVEDHNDSAGLTS